MAINLSTLSIALGLLVALPNLMGVLKPASFGAAARKFPRANPIGWALVLLATAWFVWNVNLEPISDFEKLKPALFALFIGVGIGTCVFVKDFLPVRGLAVLLLLLAKLMVDSARFVETDWRLVIVVWAYLMVVAGMWLTVSPWRLRDLINWATATEARIRALSAIRFAFGLFVLILGLTAFKSVS